VWRLVSRVVIFGWGGPSEILNKVVSLAFQMADLSVDHIASRDISRDIPFAEIIVDEMDQFVHCFILYCPRVCS
jgi:hypothetical protein